MYLSRRILSLYMIESTCRHICIMLLLLTFLLSKVSKKWLRKNDKAGKGKKMSHLSCFVAFCSFHAIFCIVVLHKAKSLICTHTTVTVITTISFVVVQCVYYCVAPAPLWAPVYYILLSFPFVQLFPPAPSSSRFQQHAIQFTLKTSIHFPFYSSVLLPGLLCS